MNPYLITGPALVADLVREVEQQPHLFDDQPDDEHDVECGDACVEEAA